MTTIRRNNERYFYEYKVNFHHDIRHGSAREGYEEFHPLAPFQKKWEKNSRQSEWGKRRKEISHASRTLSSVISLWRYRSGFASVISSYRRFRRVLVVKSGQWLVVERLQFKSWWDHPSTIVVGTQKKLPPRLQILEEKVCLMKVGAEKFILLEWQKSYKDGSDYIWQK